jgi:choline-sulfatase
LARTGNAVVTIGKLHYRTDTDPTGFPDQRIPLHVQEGVGNLKGLLRGDGPVHEASRRHVSDAGEGASDYHHYDRAVASAACEWIEQEAPRLDKPWALVVSFVAPHFPYVAPSEYWDLYRDVDIPLPATTNPALWSHHPSIEFFRRQHNLTDPLSENETRNARRAYAALVTFVDDLIGRVLDALDRAGFTGKTRVLYTSDHGDHLGDHGMWKKGTMLESSVGVPLILAGPDVPSGNVSRTNVSLIDIFPTIVEAVGAGYEYVDASLTGRSLVEISREVDHDREVFSEYHSSWSERGIYLIRRGDLKYIFHVDAPAQLFNVIDDPAEVNDLAGDSAYATVLAQMETNLRARVNPERVDRLVREHQSVRISEAGGMPVLRGERTLDYSPPPATTH